jgi:hypothetical protein
MQFPKAFIAVAVALAGMPVIINAFVLEHIDSPINLILSVMEHTPDALANLHNTPMCGQICRLDSQWKDAYGSKCVKLRTTAEKFACLCRSHAYQFGLDSCLKRQCSGDEREVVPPQSPLTFPGFGVDLGL